MSTVAKPPARLTAPRRAFKNERAYASGRPGARDNNNMHLQQVCLTALAFSSARGSAIELMATPGVRPVIIHPLPDGNQTEIYVEKDSHNAGSWLVGLKDAKPLALHSHVYFPPVNTQEALLDALTKAWELKHALPPRREPYFPRFA